MKGIRLAPVLLLCILVYWLAGCGAGGSVGFNPNPEPPTSASTRVYVSNHNLGNISTYNLNTTTGVLTPVVQTSASGSGTGFLAYDASNKRLFAVNFLSNSVSVFKVDTTTGVLTQVSGSPFATGLYPARIAVHPTGKFVYVTCKNGINAFSVNSITGALSSLAGSPYAAGVETMAGAAVSPNGKFLYVGYGPVGDAVLGFSIDENSGVLAPVPGSPFLTNQLWTQWVAIEPTGKFLYASNLTSSTLSGFAINTDGSLTQVPGSPFPAGVGAGRMDFNKTLAYVVSSDSEDVRWFSIGSNGALTLVNSLAVGIRGFGLPEQIAFTKSQNFAFITDSAGGGQVNAYSVNINTGALTPVSGSPFPGQMGSSGIVVVEP